MRRHGSARARGDPPHPPGQPRAAGGRPGASRGSRRPRSRHAPPAPGGPYRANPGVTRDDRARRPDGRRRGADARGTRPPARHGYARPRRRLRRPAGGRCARQRPRNCRRARGRAARRPAIGGGAAAAPTPAAASEARHVSRGRYEGEARLAGRPWQWRRRAVASVREAGRARRRARRAGIAHLAREAAAAAGEVAEVGDGGGDRVQGRGRRADAVRGVGGAHQSSCQGARVQALSARGAGSGPGRCSRFELLTRAPKRPPGQRKCY
jgi:hypothetical protein